MGLSSGSISTNCMLSTSFHSKFKFPIPIRFLTLNCFSSLRTTHYSAPNPHDDDNLFDPHFHDHQQPQNAIDRVVLRLRNLGSVSDTAQDCFLRREWIRPDTTLSEETVLPWEKEHHEQEEKQSKEEYEKRLRKKKVKVQSLAEVTLGEEELKRLRRVGMNIKDKDRISVPKAGLTQVVLHMIHLQWNNNEVVRLKFHELLAQNMKLAHQIVERRTRGLVIWKSGSVMWVYRGKNYQGPTSRSQPNEKGGDDCSDATSSLEEKNERVVWDQEQPEYMTPEEAEFDRMLDGFGPRFVEWWGTGILPVDADLLPPTVPGYKTPLRLLPAGMRPGLTNDELTNMRKLSKSLPSHFALGRNRNLQGLACAILKLWEKSLVAKIAVKRGIVNTNNELMAEELKKLTGGTLLLRNKFYIVIYRGRDFISTNVATALAERQELRRQVQDVEEEVRCRAVDVAPSGEDEATSQAGSLAEFYEAQGCWGRDISTEERDKMMKEAAEAKNVRLVKKIEHKLAVAQAKRQRAEKLLSKIEASMVPASPDNDQETITDEERVMFRSIGLRMKMCLQLGTRGVFDGVIENMHLHWKHRELVKLITKQKTLAFVKDTARLLEHESGGILVAIDKLPKGFSLIYYRGKNYRQPLTLRPRTLLTKAKALQRSIAMQRHEALSQHITELGKKIEEMKKEGLSQDLEPEDRCCIEDHNRIEHISDFTPSEDEDTDDDDKDSDFNDIEDSDWNDDDSEYSNLEKDEIPVKAG